MQELLSFFTTIGPAVTARMVSVLATYPAATRTGMRRLERDTTWAISS